MFAVIPYDEFVRIQEALQDYEDIIALGQAKKKERNAPTVSLEEAKSLLGI